MDRCTTRPKWLGPIPTVMLFVQSLHGISHNKIEDTRREHIEASVRTLDRLTEKAMAQVAG